MGQWQLSENCILSVCKLKLWQALPMPMSSPFSHCPFFFFFFLYPSIYTSYILYCLKYNIRFTNTNFYLYIICIVQICTCICNYVTISKTKCLYTLSDNILLTSLIILCYSRILNRFLLFFLLSLYRVSDNYNIHMVIMFLQLR